MKSAEEVAEEILRTMDFMPTDWRKSVVAKALTEYAEERERQWISQERYLGFREGVLKTKDVVSDHWSEPEGYLELLSKINALLPPPDRRNH